MPAHRLFRGYTQSSSFRIAVLFTVLCGLSVLVLGYFGAYFSRGHFIKGTEEVIETEIKYITPLEEAGRLRDFIAEYKDTDRLYVLYDDQSDVLAGQSQDVSFLSKGIIAFDHAANGHRYAAKIHTFEDGKKLLIGIDVSDVADDYAFMKFLSIVSIVMMMVVIAVSFLTSVYAVGGTNKIACAAWDIVDTGDLSRRLETNLFLSELNKMAVLLNTLFGRIGGLVQGVRQVSDNIAHDLRTPLTRLRNNIERLNKAEPREEYEELLREADNLLSTFNALLRISRIEFEHQRERFSSVDMGALVADVIAFYEPMAEDKLIVLKADIANVAVKGDRDLLFQAFANLLDNAIKFAPQNGQVKVVLGSDKKGVFFEVTDNGPGVEDCDKDKIFNRFYRVSKCRSMPGTGLGLSLVAAVVTLHQGTIVSEDANPGLRIRILFS